MGDGDALFSRAQGRVGTVLRGKYHLDRVLGVGGMAAVYKATHRNEAEFAIKILHPELSFREDLCARFLREGKAANSVKHPGVVRVVDDDVAEDGAAFLVMELLDGAVVEALWQRDHYRVPVHVALALADQLLDVLAAAHEKGVVHRDIKPANLFVVGDGTLKVLDFGIARVKDIAGSDATRSGTVMGTAAFMAPEQAFGIANEIDGQSDVWSVGATLYALLSGQLVHQGENAAQILVLAATRRARLIGDVVPGLSPAVADVIDRALSFERATRWPSAVAMRRALQDASVAAFGARLSRPELEGWARGGAEPHREAGSRIEGRVPTLAAGASDVAVFQPPPIPTTGRAVSWRQSAPASVGAGGGRRSATLGAMIAAAVAAALLAIGAFVAVGRSARETRENTAQNATGSPAQPESIATLTPVLAATETSIAVSLGPSDADASLTQSRPIDAGRARTVPPRSGTSQTPEVVESRSTDSVRAATSVGPPPPRPKATVDCEPPTFLDDKGHVHLKPGCQ